ncbi:MAG: YceI family protein [Micrococcales bacterium]|nr:YceI family protein [Micrococcales bacterium]
MTALTDLTAGTWTIDQTHSSLGFTAKHMMVSKVRGTFDDFAGTVTVAEPLADSTVDVTIQMASVNTNQADRDAHLRGEDFFDVEQFPTMTFRGTSFDGETLRGDLTIKGVTRPVELDVDFGGVGTDPYGNTKAGFEAETEINRKDFGLTWNVAMETGGVLVSEKIKIILDVQLVKA